MNLIILNRRIFKHITKYMDCVSNALVLYDGNPSSILLPIKQVGYLMSYTNNYNALNFLPGGCYDYSNYLSYSD
jgi:hypothetical protein